jgi:tetratricopeptide (TPR) repeat protein
MKLDNQFLKAWEGELERTLDFDRAFQSLAGVEHYHADTLRSMVRRFQVRFQDSLRHSDWALEKFPTEPTSDDLTRYVRILAGRFESCLSMEMQSPTERNRCRTDESIDRLLESDLADGQIGRRLRQRAQGLFCLARGRFGDALEAFQELIQENRNEVRYCSLAYVGAAAAAFELGSYKESRRHYENAELCMAFQPSRWVFSVFVSWLAGVCEHWGWDGEAKRWQETLNAIDCPAATRECLRRRSELLAKTVRSGACLVLA